MQVLPDEAQEMAVVRNVEIGAVRHPAKHLADVLLQTIMLDCHHRRHFHCTVTVAIAITVAIAVTN